MFIKCGLFLISDLYLRNNIFSIDIKFIIYSSLKESLKQVQHYHLKKLSIKNYFDQTLSQD